MFFGYLPPQWYFTYFVPALVGLGFLYIFLRADRLPKQKDNGDFPFTDSFKSNLSNKKENTKED